MFPDKVKGEPMNHSAFLAPKKFLLSFLHHIDSLNPLKNSRSVR